MPDLAFLGISNNPLYQIVYLIILAELLLMVGQITYLAIRSTITGSRLRKSEEFNKRLGELFWDILDDKEELEDWISYADEFPKYIVSDFFQNHFQFVSGEYKEKLTRTYRRLKCHESDLNDLRSMSWNKRFTALRRISHVATEKEKEALLAMKDKSILNRILAARIMVEIGGADDIFELIKDLRLTRRLMEQPLYIVFHEMAPEKFTRLMEKWPDFSGPIVKRILLVTAAEKYPVVCEAWMEIAYRSRSIELRIGVCMSAGLLRSSATRNILLHLLGDPHWEVRAQAVKALGARNEVSTISEIAGAMTDPSFWVRQNAAGALSSMGSTGIKKLKFIAKSHEDLFAKDTAKQELERYKINVNIGVVSA